MNDFVHLHNHSEYSLLDGLSKLSEMITRVIEVDQQAIALTDHGNVHGAIDFYQTAKKSGIKPIIGVEGYVANGSRSERNSNERQPYHITLLAQNLTGYKNILKLVTKANLEGFYYRPRFDREILEKYNEGIIVLSGCPSSELGKHIKIDQHEKAGDTIDWYQEVFNNRYYLELMMHEGVPEQEKINKALVEFSKDKKVPLVVTNDTHYVRPDDAYLQDILTCIVTNSHVNDPKRMRLEDQTYYIRSGDEMASQWKELPDGIRNTMVIAESCELDLTFGKTLLPRFQTPEGITSMDYLRQLCSEGVRKRFNNPDPKVIDRLEHELEVIEKTKFADYFLVCWDIFNFVNRREILSAVRGSAASSMVLYCLEITQVDPLKNGLIFERFLNVERQEMPDIDMDFADDRREEVIRYCVERYGRDHVAQIITFGTLGARAAVRDTTRALNMDISLGDKIARLIPNRLNITLEEAVSENQDLQELVNDNADAHKVLAIAKGVEGSVRHASTHAAGVVISDEPLTNYVALQRSTSGDDTAPPTTQFAMKPVAEVGLLKMDFLGLTNLTILDKTAKYILKQRGEKLNIYEIPLDDPDTFALLEIGNTFGVFQLESQGMRRHITQLKPSSIADVSAMIALYRPGPMEEIETFISAKHGIVEIKYPHDDLKHILEESYGVIVYQDQVMLIAQHFGGYTLGEADILRKAMGKKIPSVMRSEKTKFIEGATKKGYSENEADKVFALMEPFAGYGFNKSHAISYALIAYWTAYFKANYPVEYLAAFMDSTTSNSEKLAQCIREARRADIVILSPDINKSETGFNIEEIKLGYAGIRFGLAAIKNIGESALNPIIAEREANGVFLSLEDFCRRVDSKSINRRSLESLIKVGTLDAFGTRNGLLENLDRIISSIHRQTDLRESGQTSMFDLFGESIQKPMTEIVITEDSKESDQERVNWERELLGIELTETPESRRIGSMQSTHTIFTSDLKIDKVGDTINVVGQIGKVTERKTRRGDAFLSFDFQFLDGIAEAVVWPDLLEKTSSIWMEGKYVIGKAKLRERAGHLSLSFITVQSFNHVQENNSDEINQATVVEESNTSENYPTQQTNVSLKKNLNGEKAGLLKSINEYPLSESAVEKTWVVEIQESLNADEDRNNLEDIVRLLLEYPGKMAVALDVTTSDSQKVRLDMPFAKVNASTELEKRLLEIKGVRVGKTASGKV